MYRTIRGAMDKRNPSMLKSLGAFIEYDGAVGILIEGKICASMKGKLYDGAVAFTLLMSPMTK